MAGIAAQIEIHRREQEILRKILRSKALGIVLHELARIVLAAENSLIFKFNRNTVSKNATSPLENAISR